METGSGHTKKPSRFYEAPTEEAIEAEGTLIAEIRARIRARIVGSRVINSLVVLATGSLITTQEIMTNGYEKPLDLLTNYGFPAIFNGIAQMKIERSLRKTEDDMVMGITELQHNNAGALPINSLNIGVITSQIYFVETANNEIPPQPTGT